MEIKPIKHMLQRDWTGKDNFEGGKGGWERYVKYYATGIKIGFCTFYFYITL